MGKAKRLNAGSINFKKIFTNKQNSSFKGVRGYDTQLHKNRLPQFVEKQNLHSYQYYWVVGCLRK